jgi:hypothetical protein
VILEGGGIIRLGAVVVTVTRVMTAPPLGVIGLCAAVHVDNVKVGGSVHAIVTGELNPPIGVTVTVKVAELPAFTGDGVGAVAVIVKSGAMFVPLPFRVNTCGLVLSPSVRVSVAVSGPTTDGLNVTLTAQGVVVVMLGLQLAGVAVKSALFAPVTAALVNGIAAFVLFVSVTVFAALVVPISTVPKSSVDPGAGDTIKVGISVSFATNAAEWSPLGKLVWNAGGTAVAGGKTGKVAAEENVNPVI